MALRFIDSFDHYQTANVLDKYTSGGPCAIVPAVGRCGTQAMRVSQQLTKGIPYGSNVVVAGFAGDFFPYSNGDMDFFKFLIGPSTGIFLHRYADGSVRVFNGSSVALATSAADVLRQDQYYFIEVAYTTGTVSGVVNIYVNELLVLSFTGNTGSSGTPTGFVFMGSTNQQWYVDDFYTLDNTGAVNTARLGDVRVQYLRPTSPGDATGLTLVGAATDWQAVDNNATPDDDTSYVWGDTIGLHDLYEYENVALPLGGSIFGVQISPLARKTDAGVRSIASVAKIAGTEYPSANSSISQTYQNWHTIWEVNPGTAVAWVKADLNTAPKAQFGPKVTG